MGTGVSKRLRRRKKGKRGAGEDGEEAEEKFDDLRDGGGAEEGSKEAETADGSSSKKKSKKSSKKKGKKKKKEKKVGRVRRLSMAHTQMKGLSISKVDDDDDDESDGDGDEMVEGATVKRTSSIRDKTLEWLEWAAVSHAGYESSGYKKTNQDSYLVVPEFEEHRSHYLFGVFDGHGTEGHFASQFCVEKMAENMATNLTKRRRSSIARVLGAEAADAGSSRDGLDPEQRLRYAFLQTNKLLHKSAVDSMLSGSTAVVVYMRGKRIWVANAGDSRAVMGRVDGRGRLRAVDLSKDQKPDDPEEKLRIERMGGKVEPIFDEYYNEFVGPARVWSLKWDGRLPGLAMARSLGDMVAEEVGCIAEPVVEAYDIDLSTDRYIIIASDGVWEFISSQEALDIVASIEDPEEAAEQLCAVSLRKWREEEDVVDDITAIVLKFDASKDEAPADLDELADAVVIEDDEDDDE